MQEQKRLAFFQNPYFKYTKPYICNKKKETTIKVLSGRSESPVPQIMISQEGDGEGVNGQIMFHRES